MLVAALIVTVEYGAEKIAEFVGFFEQNLTVMSIIQDSKLENLFDNSLDKLDLLA